MSNKRKEMIEAMIALYGYEHPAVVQFCDFCERLEENEWNNRMLEILLHAHQFDPVSN
jgi:DNA polymerase III alpha subunit